MKFSPAISLVLTIAMSCAAADTTLKDAFKDRFLVGAALNQWQFTDKAPRETAIVLQQFNSISPENVLKWESVHPRANQFDFSLSDKYVDFGVSNNMFVIGHNLVWHSQTPGWVFQDDKGQPLDRDALLARMHDHISTVVGRYKGKINGWDVVNEALDEDGSLRKSQWDKIIGDDYLVKAYEFAHEADPTAELHY